MPLSHRATPALVLLPAIVIVAADVATAADAYLCDGNRLVYVELAELEHKIRTDPCIARYHLALPGQTDASSGEPPLVRFSDPIEAPRVASMPASEAATAIEQLQRAAKPATRIGKLRGVGARPAEPVGVRAAPDTDYRNVRIINASQEGDRWYRLPRP